MPMPNFHSARVRDPDDFVRIVQLKELENGIRIIGGPLKSDPDGPSHAQAYRFPKDKFTVAEAKKWLKDHDIKWIDFEPASEEKDQPCQLERRFFSLSEIRLGGDGANELFGHASIFNKTVDLGWFDEKVAPGAFGKSLQRGDDVVSLFNHDPNHLLGRRSAKTLELKEDDTGLFFNDYLPDTQMSRDIKVLVARGDLKGCSFGFITRAEEWVYGERKLRILKEVDLIDVSIVTFPAYPQTDVALRSFERSQQIQPGKSSWKEIIEIKRKKLQICFY